MERIINSLYADGIVPVVQVTEPAKGVQLAKTLLENGIFSMEITLRTEQAVAAIEAVTKEVPQMLVGAGTVHSAEQVCAVRKAGAAFIVTPGFYEEVIGACKEQGLPVIPGCNTPADMRKALEMGITCVKFYPAQASGGVAYLKAMQGPYPSLKFMPTGGISEKNLAEYLELKNVLAAGGTWFVPQKLVDAGEFEEIGRLTREAVRIVHGFAVKHIGFNCQGEEAYQVADHLCHLFAAEKNEVEKSIFAGPEFEVIKNPFLGTHGHICIAARSVPRAFEHLKKIGCEFAMDTAGYDENGEMNVIYLAGEIGGFAYHLFAK